MRTGCNYFSVKKIKREEVKNNQLQEVRSNALENYPKIEFCEESKNSKECFEKQLLNHLNTSLESPDVNAIHTPKKDTLWLVVHVSKDGQMSLKDQQVEEEFKDIVAKIDSTLLAISPIEPAHTQGVKVSCNFKLPLVINKENN